MTSHLLCSFDITRIITGLIGYHETKLIELYIGLEMAMIIAVTNDDNFSVPHYDYDDYWISFGRQSVVLGSGQN